MRYESTGAEVFIGATRSTLLYLIIALVLETRVRNPGANPITPNKLNSNKYIILLSTYYNKNRYNWIRLLYDWL